MGPHFGTVFETSHDLLECPPLVLIDPDQCIAIIATVFVIVPSDIQARPLQDNWVFLICCQLS